MAYLKEEAKWEEGVYQFEVDDPLQGGEDGIDNVQGKALANRTQWLKKKLEAATARTETDTAAKNDYTAGDQFFIGDKLCTATKTIAAGDTLKEGENYEAGGTTGAQLAAHKADNGNPHGVTAAQTGAYAKAEVDGMIADTHVSALTDESQARNILDVLGIRTVHSDEPATAEESRLVIPKLKEWYAERRFRGLRYCDYLDLSEITVDGVTYKWNAEYKNLRLMVMGFDTLLYAGDTENVRHHILFQFRNNVLEKRMNGTNSNTGGYPSSELRAWLNDKFKAGLVAVLGDGLVEMQRLYSTKEDWEWCDDTVFLPEESEVWGCPVWGEKTWNGFQAQWKPYQDSSIYKVKRLNGSRKGWWEATPSEENTSCFCGCDDGGGAADASAASWAGGISPAFCVGVDDTQS